VMGKIIDVREVQKELNRAARDARHGPADVRAGRFVHANDRGDEAAAKSTRRGPPSKAVPARNSKPVR
jgi:hypothetical protein